MNCHSIEDCNSGIILEDSLRTSPGYTYALVELILNIIKSASDHNNFSSEQVYVSTTYLFHGRIQRGPGGLQVAIGFPGNTGTDNPREAI